MANESFDPYEYHHEAVHVPHAGKDVAFQEISLPGQMSVDVEIDTDHHLLSLIRLLDRQLNETLVSSPFQGVPLTNPSTYKGRSLYGTQQVSGDGKFAGWSIALDNFSNASTSSVLMFIFDGNDSNGVLLSCEEIFTSSTSSAAGSSSMNSDIYSLPIRFNNGLYVAFAAQSPFTMIPNVRGSFFIVQE